VKVHVGCVQESADLTVQLRDMTERASKDKSEADRKLDSAKDYIARMQNERSDIDKRFHAMKDDLLTRLQNACAQRDEARAQVSANKACCTAGLPAILSSASLFVKMCTRRFIL
jgi:hypothetical protein